MTPEFTRDVCLSTKMMAANLYFSQLSMWRCSDELCLLADELHGSSRRDAKHYIEFWKHIPANETYRVILGDVRDKLYNTREHSRQLLSQGVSDIPEDATYTDVEQGWIFVKNQTVTLMSWMPLANTWKLVPTKNGLKRRDKIGFCLN